MTLLESFLIAFSIVGGAVSLMLIISAMVMFIGGPITITIIILVMFFVMWVIVHKTW